MFSPWFAPSSPRCRTTPRGWRAWCASVVLMVASGGAGCSFREPPPSEPLAVAISGDTAGWIVPCGCTTNQSGGLLRRGTYLNQLRQQGELIYLDAGGAVSGSAPYDIAKFEAILAGEKEMGVALHNIGAAEAALGAAELRRIEAELGAPLFVSANLRDPSGQPVGIPSQVLEAAGRRVLVIGVLSADFPIGDFLVTPPRKAILAELERSNAAGGHDAAIVLAYAPEAELRELAEQLPEIDAIVGGPTGQAMAPQRNGAVLLAAATNKGKFLVHLHLPPTVGQPISGEVVEMTEDFADAPDQQANLDRFYKQLAAHDFTASQTSFEPHALGGGRSLSIAGTQTCRDCHSSDCQLWEETAHAHAWQTLRETGAHVDSYCQQCHVTGFGAPGGFISAKRSPQHVNVGCESCHGPSQQHADDPTIRTPYYQNAAATCVRCHDRENSPQFDYGTYWPPIEHGTKGPQ